MAQKNRKTRYIIAFAAMIVLLVLLFLLECRGRKCGDVVDRFCTFDAKAGCR